MAVFGLKSTALALAMLPLLAASAAACSRAMPDGANTEIRPESRIDQGLLDNLIRAELNYHRCKAGLSPLVGKNRLARVAGQHATWMARARTLSHRSTTPGQTSTLARLKASGVRFRAGSENLGQVARFRIDGRSFRIADASNCRFLGNDGRPIPTHSYGSLARTVVTLWMASPAHRRNILDRRVSFVGTGVGFDARAPYCGNYYVSQSFAG